MLRKTFVKTVAKYTLDKPERGSKHGQSRHTDNIKYTGCRTKTNKTHKNTKQKTEKMSNTNPTNNWWVMNPGECSLIFI